MPIAEVRPIPFRSAKILLTERHYLHSMPGGTYLAFGVFKHKRLLGAITLGVGPKNAHRLVANATPVDLLVLSRLWLSDELPSNSESFVIGQVLQAIRRHTDVKFAVTYADPSKGHVGTIYQASNWLYTGRSQSMPVYDLGDGIHHHSRTLSHVYGTHSLAYFRAKGINIRTISQSSKHRYVYFLNPSWRNRLAVPILPYPKEITC
jgi:hypothetical protein